MDICLDFRMSYVCCMDVYVSVWIYVCLSGYGLVYLCLDMYLSDLLSVWMSPFLSIWMSVLMSKKQFGCPSGYLCVWFSWCLKQMSVLKRDWSAVLNNCSACLDLYVWIIVCLDVFFYLWMNVCLSVYNVWSVDVRMSPHLS